MSAKDAPGEVNKDKVFDSSSSSSGDDEIIYKAADIKKRRKTEFFVNVEGAEERAKAAQKRLEEEEKAIAKAEKDLQKIADAEQAEVDRELVEERKKVDEVNAYIQKQRKEKVKAEVKARNKKRNSRITKIVTIAVVAVAVIAIAVITVVNLVIIPEQKRLAEEEEQRRIDEQVKAEFLAVEHNAIIAKLNVDADLFEAVENYHFDDVKRIYAEYLEDVTDNETKAYVYLDMADRIAAHTTDEYDEIIKQIIDKMEATSSADVYGVSISKTMLIEMVKKGYVLSYSESNNGMFDLSCDFKLFYYLDLKKEYEYASSCTRE